MGQTWLNGTENIKREFYVEEKEKGMVGLGGDVYQQATGGKKVKSDDWKWSWNVTGKPASWEEKKCVQVECKEDKDTSDTDRCSGSGVLTLV